jgi:hypothetical protein
LSSLRLSFAHYVDHLDLTLDRASAAHWPEPEHWSDPPLDGAMILFDAIVQVGTLPDPDRPQFLS